MGDHLVDEGTEKWEAKRSDLKSHFLAHIEELGGTYKIEGGIVYASLPDGTKWDFTVPEKKTAIMKFCLLHPSDRVLRAGPHGGEVWDGDPRGEEVILFDTEARAHERIAERAKQYPNGDWPNVTVGRFTPGQPRIYPHEPVR